jgi:hypothetical protein
MMHEIPLPADGSKLATFGFCFGGKLDTKQLIRARTEGNFFRFTGISIPGSID